jgi:hypothetical protein
MNVRSWRVSGFDPDHVQAGSYQLAGRVTTDKRASSDRPIAGEKPTQNDSQVGERSFKAERVGSVH